MPNLENDSVYWCVIVALDVIHLRPVYYVAHFQKLFSMWLALCPRLSLGRRDGRRSDHDKAEHRDEERHPHLLVWCLEEK